MISVDYVAVHVHGHVKRQMYRIILEKIVKNGLDRMKDELPFFLALSCSSVLYSLSPIVPQVTRREIF